MLPRPRCTVLSPGVLVLALVGFGALLPGCESMPAHHPRIVPAHYDGSFTTWWNDKVIKEVGTYEAGLRHGDIEVYHPTGTLQMQGHFVHGLPEGELRTFHPNGSLAGLETYRGGRLDGVRERYSPTTGVVVERTEFVEGTKHGLDEQWLENGVRVLEGHWSHDLPTGPWRHWDGVSRLAREEHYWIAGGVPSGYLETVYATDGKVSVQTLMTQHDSLWKGWQTTWHDNGRQAGFVEYEGDQRQGRDLSWDRSGALVAEGLRVHDKRSGPWTFFGGRGEVARTVVYEDGNELPAPGATAEAPPSDGL